MNNKEGKQTVERLRLHDIGPGIKIVAPSGYAENPEPANYLSY